MSKSHAAGWASDAPMPAQLKELFAQIESGRITGSRLQGFLVRRWETEYEAWTERLKKENPHYINLTGLELYHYDHMGALDLALMPQDAVAKVNSHELLTDQTFFANSVSIDVVREAESYRDLPEPRPGICLVVSLDVALAARSAGRLVFDLLIPEGLEVLGKRASFKNFRRL